nr:interleukin-31 receptor subunit alpha-like [Zootoca vivipara]
MRRRLFFAVLAWLAVASSFGERNGLSVWGGTGYGFNHSLSAPDSSDFSYCGRPSCTLHPDWHDYLTCYYSEEKLILNCSWLPLPHATDSLVYTVFLKWKLETKQHCEKVETTLPLLTRRKHHIRIHANVTVWVSGRYSHEGCMTTKKISFVPSKTKKCPSPFRIRAYQLFHKLIIMWDSPRDVLQYELRYKEATQATSSWISVPIENGTFNATIFNVDISSSYVACLRCKPPGKSCSVCAWSEDIVIPHKLTEKPAIVENATEKIAQGKISIFLKWKTTQSRHTIGYNISVERIPRYCRHILTYLNITENWVHLNLSMAYYRIKISAYNEAGESPPLTYLVPDFTAKPMDLPGQFNLSNQQNYSVITWDLKHSSDCIVIDWGTGLEDMKIHVSTWKNEIRLDGLQPYKLYKVTFHAFDCQCEDFMEREWTLARTYFYAVEGVPKIGPANVTVPVVTKQSAVVKWAAIPIEECLGFLLGYRIRYTEILKNLSVAVTVSPSTQQYLMTGLMAKTLYRVQTSGLTSKGEGAQSQPQIFTTLKYDPGEFEESVAGLCLGLMVTMTATAMLCFLILKRSRKLCWPAVPNPKYSTALLNMERTTPVVLLGPSLQTPSQAYNEANELYVVNDDSETLLRQGSLFPGAATMVSTDHSEAVARQILDTALNPLKIHDQVSSGEKGKLGIHTDYIGVAVSQRAMQKLSTHLPKGAAHLERKLINNSRRQPAAYTAQNPLMPSQGVLSPATLSLEMSKFEQNHHESLVGMNSN